MSINTSINDGCWLKRLDQVEKEAQAALMSGNNGLISHEGDYRDALSINPGDSTLLDIKAGTGQIIDTANTIVSGKVDLIRLEWEDMTVATPPFDGKQSPYIVSLDKDSNVVFLRNEDLGLVAGLSVPQSLDYVQLGSLQMNPDNTISFVFAIAKPAFTLQSDVYDLVLALGPFNYPGNTAVSPILNPGGLTTGVTAGKAHGLQGHYVVNPRYPNTVILENETPVVFVVFLVEPDTGVFSISATGEVDPTLVGKEGRITAFADAGSGDVTVTSNAHGMQVGDTVQIEGTTNYDGRYPIVSVTGNTYNITATFVANDATGSWSGLTDVTAFKFTGQRFSYLVDPWLLATYGKAEYDSIAQYDTLYGEISEGYVESALASAALLSQLFIVRQDVTDFADVNNYLVRPVTARVKN